MILMHWLPDAMGKLYEAFPEVTRIRVRHNERSLEMHFKPRLFMVVPFEAIGEILSSPEILDEWHKSLREASEGAPA